jgi:NAD(P)H-hydrate epimerase
MKIVTGIQMQTLDRRTILEARVPSLILMERAATGLADVILSRF